MKNNLPKEVVDMLELINSNNKEAYLVGGAVRDILLNRLPKDYDICTNMPLEEIKELLPAFHIMKQNERRNAGIIRINDIDIEISLFKGETLDDDLRKRDFTINSIIMNKEKKIIDILGGLDNLNSKKIILIDKTGHSIEENPLLILRAIRLSAQLGFTIDEQTKHQIFYYKHLLQDVLGQRIYIELTKILSTDNFPEIFQE